jgi:hypothetical protein
MLVIREEENASVSVEQKLLLGILNITAVCRDTCISCVFCSDIKAA